RLARCALPDAAAGGQRRPHRSGGRGERIDWLDSRQRSRGRARCGPLDLLREAGGVQPARARLPPPSCQIGPAGIKQSQEGDKAMIKRKSLAPALCLAAAGLAAHAQNVGSFRDAGKAAVNYTNPVVSSTGDCAKLGQQVVSVEGTRMTVLA